MVASAARFASALPPHGLPCARCVRVELSRALAVALAAVCVLGVGGAVRAAEAPVGAEGWQGLLGTPPAAAAGRPLGSRPRTPSLADRVRRAGGAATELQMRSRTNAAEAAQQRAIAGLWSRGAPVDPEQSYVRVLNGFAASVDPMLLLPSSATPRWAGVYPVRAAYPAAAPPAVLDTEAFGPQSGRRVDVGIPGADGSGGTVALLDTGIDTRHPFLQGRLLPGIDVLDADGNLVRGAEPDRARAARAARNGARGPRGRHSRPRRARRGRAGSIAAPDPGRRMAAGRRRWRLGLRTHRPGARRAGGRRRPERRR